MTSPKVEQYDENKLSSDHTAAARRLKKQESRWASSFSCGSVHNEMIERSSERGGRPGSQIKGLPRLLDEGEAG